MKFVSALVFILAAAAGFEASAVDLAVFEGPSKVADGKITIGNKTIILPPGEWSYIAHTKSQTMGERNTPPTDSHRGYFINIKDGAFKMQLVLHLLLRPIFRTG